MILDVMFYAVYFSSFVIGVVLGGMVAFLVRRMVFNRQLRIAERRAAKWWPRPETMPKI